MRSLIEAADAIGTAVDAVQLERFRTYRDLIIDWGGRMNLTGVKHPDAIVEELFVRSLRIAVPAGGSVSTVEWFDSRRIIDIGTGAGIPGLPLKLLIPGIEVTLLESSRKKCDFLEHVVETLSLDGVTVLNARAEHAAHLTSHRESYDLATARGVARLSVLAEYGLPFLKLGGVAVFPKGPNLEAVQAEADAAVFAADTLGAAPAYIQPVAYPGSSPMDCIVYWMKIGTTPMRYPRHTGIPSKRPLSAAQPSGSVPR